MERELKATLPDLVPSAPFRLAYDITLMRPACVLVAAALGADSRIPMLFPTESWLLSPTPDMKVYTTTPGELLIAIHRTTERLSAEQPSAPNPHQPPSK